MTRSVYRFPAPGRSNDLSKALYTYLQRSGLRMLNDEHKKAPVSEVPSVEVIYDLLWDLCQEKGSKVIAWYDPDSARISGRRSKITDSNAERICRNAAQFIHDSWDPFYCEKRSELARRPRPKARVATLGDLLALPVGLSKAEAAKALGCSPRTVARLRAAALSGTPSATQPEVVAAPSGTPSGTPSATQPEVVNAQVAALSGTPDSPGIGGLLDASWLDYAPSVRPVLTMEELDALWDQKMAVYAEATPHPWSPEYQLELDAIYAEFVTY